MQIEQYGEIVYVPDLGEANAISLTWSGGDHRLFIEGTPEAPGQVCFACPCGSPDHGPVVLPLKGERAWQHEVHADGTLTLSPSIMLSRGTDREHHFFLRQSKVVWS